MGIGVGYLVVSTSAGVLDGVEDQLTKTVDVDLTAVAGVWNAVRNYYGGPGVIRGRILSHLVVIGAAD